ncbi:wall-associated receptor kinase 3-like [Cryptomeria japonica]|uniref:wall-associated receptor kinase 3-like n=1 Tax=Cryptomeria japonica TaxID=3369 RepID=UPI0027DA4656|nr:wall-associated receptor kinase 3-like [Cryptomeria japonica]
MTELLTPLAVAINVLLQHLVQLLFCLLFSVSVTVIVILNKKKPRNISKSFHYYTSRRSLLIRSVICLCLVGFIAAKCVPERCGSMSVSYAFWINNSDCGYPGFNIICKKSKYTGMFAPFFRAYADNWQWVNFTGGGMFGLRNDTTNIFDDKCGFSTVLEPSTFTQVDNETNLFWGQGRKAYYGLRLNWGISLQNCSMATATANYSCSFNAECLDSPSGQGHVCKCLPGYEGNDYSNGTACTDVDECSNPNLNICVGRLKGGICHNLVGAYNCSCGKGYIGDGLQIGTGCASTNSNSSIIPAIIGSLSSFVGVSLGAFGLFWWFRWRRLRRDFKHNCGIRLQKEIASKGGKDFKIFSERELQRASKSYSTELGRGGFGKVYKGKLSDGRELAIKMAVSAPMS